MADNFEIFRNSTRKRLDFLLELEAADGEFHAQSVDTIIDLIREKSVAEIGDH